MMDDFQSVLMHRVPKTGSYSRPRINITYRRSRVDKTKLNPKTPAQTDEVNEEEEMNEDRLKKITTKDVMMNVPAVTHRPVEEARHQEKALRLCTLLS